MHLSDCDFKAGIREGNLHWTNPEPRSIVNGAKMLPGTLGTLSAKRIMTNLFHAKLTNDFVHFFPS